MLIPVVNFVLALVPETLTAPGGETSEFIEINY